MKIVTLLFLCVFGITVASKHPPISAKDSTKIATIYTVVDSINSKALEPSKKTINIDSLNKITNLHIYEVKKIMKQHKVLKEKVKNLENINEELLNYIDTNLITKGSLNINYYK